MGIVVIIQRLYKTILFLHLLLASALDAPSLYSALCEDAEGEGKICPVELVLGFTFEMTFGCMPVVLGFAVWTTFYSMPVEFVLCLVAWVIF